MSDAQSYQAGNIDKDRVVYLASDFDNVTRLFLDAAERCVAAERREKELQQCLTAADDRADVLEGLLRRWLSRHAMGAGTDSMVIAETIAAVGLPALKPAEAAKCKACDGKRSVCIDWEAGAWTECTYCAKTERG